MKKMAIGRNLYKDNNSDVGTASDDMEPCKSGLDNQHRKLCHAGELEDSDGDEALIMDDESDEEMIEAIRCTALQRKQATPQVSRWTSGIGTIAKDMQRQHQHQQLQGNLEVSATSVAATTAKNLLGPPTLMKQLEAVFTEIEHISSTRSSHTVSPKGKTGLASPLRQSSWFGTRKGEKKRLIEKYKAQLAALEGKRKEASEEMRKAIQTGGVALGMLKEEWTRTDIDTLRKARELEKVQELLGRHEAESTQLRITVSGLRRQVEELVNRAQSVPRGSQDDEQKEEELLSDSPLMVSATSSPIQECSVRETSAKTSSPPASSEMGKELVVNDARLAQLEMELDLAYGKLEALSLQQCHSQDKSTGVLQQLRGELKETKLALAARVKKHTEMKERCRQLEGELGASVGQIEAVKHQMELRVAKMEDRLKESMREALENERTAKNALFKRQQVEEEMERLREQHDVLVGQFEAIRSQVELEKLEAQGVVTKYEKELEEVYGKLNAKDEYAGLLCGVRQDMDSEMTDLWSQVDAAEEKRAKVEEAFVALGNKFRAASARRLFNFMVAQQRCRLRESLIILKKNSKAPLLQADVP